MAALFFCPDRVILLALGPFALESILEEHIGRNQGNDNYQDYHKPIVRAHLFTPCPRIIVLIPDG